MLSMVYVSFATVPFSDADLDALLAKSRANNVRDGISGMLLYCGGEAYQYLLGFRQIAS
ncbi:MAG: BLUF domain-containing protein [Gammaproteobacteria bacterium]